ncbi:hypothetical protein BZG04_07625 [Salinivibrio kushneri]|nr:hypothetical protein BZG04_07625 [Salinivibrio kushneri]
MVFLIKVLCGKSVVALAAP